MTSSILIGIFPYKPINHQRSKGFRMTCHFDTRDPGPHARAPDSRRGVRAARHEQGAPQTWRCCGWLGNHQFYPCLSHEFSLVVEVSTPLKNMSSSNGMMNLPIYGQIKKCFKPPTRVYRVSTIF